MNAMQINRRAVERSNCKGSGKENAQILSYRWAFSMALSKILVHNVKISLMSYIRVLFWLKLSLDKTSYASNVKCVLSFMRRQLQSCYPPNFGDNDVPTY